MTALLYVAVGLVVSAWFGGVAVTAIFDTSGHWWVRPVAVICAVTAVAGLVLVARGLGFGYVGAP